MDVDPRTVPLRVEELHGAPGYWVVVPDVDDPPPETWLRFKVLPRGGVRVTEIKVAPDLRRHGLGRRMVEQLLQHAGRGPGDLATTRPLDAEARVFWRAMRDRHHVVPVDYEGSPWGLDD